MYVHISVFRYVHISTDACWGQTRSCAPHSVWVLGTELRSSAGAVHSTHLTPELPLLPPKGSSCLYYKSLSHLGPSRKQLQELSGQHQQELAAQLAQFKVEMADREERQQQVAQDYELRYWPRSSCHG